jgi:hypothetical protein
MKRSIAWLLIGFCWIAATPAVHAVTVAPILQSKDGMVTTAHPLADNLDRFMQENDGWARKFDQQAYRALLKAPVKGSYRGYELSVPGSPVGGPRIFATLNILEHFNLAIMSWDDPLAIHIMQEAMILTSLDQRRCMGSIRRLGGAAAPQLKTGK